MKLIKHSDYIFTIENFWSPQQCDHFITVSESIGFKPAKVQTEREQKVVKSIRNNQRVLFPDHDLANQLWNQLHPFVPKSIGYSRAIGLNEMFRFYKYEPGQEFRKHRDQSFIRNEFESSYFTFMIYLNDGFEGGETQFNEIAIKPTKGSALFFLHDLEHSGNRLLEGKKHVLRTDVMYRLTN